jgi:hypothetical protein
MGKEIFAVSQRQKSSHSEALKSSPRKETDGSGASFSVTRKSSGSAGEWMRIIPGPGIGAVPAVARKISTWFGTMASEHNVRS